MDFQKKKNFAIVVFKADEGVCVVPVKNWISEDGQQCKWPIKYPPDFRKLTQDPNSVPGEDWTWLDIDVKKQYEYFENANAKLAKYKKVDAEASSSELEGTPRRPRQTKGRRSSANQHVFQVPIEAVHTDSRDSKPVQPAPVFQPSVSLQLPNQTVDSSSASTIGSLEPPIVHPEVVAPAQEVNFVIVDESLKTSVEGLKQELRGFETVVLGKLEELTNQVKNCQKLLMSIVSSQTSANPIASSPVVFRYIPIATEEDLSSLEHELQSSSDSFQQLVTYLKRGGGSTLSDNVHNILRSLFTDQMAKNVRLTTKTGKLGFKDSKLAECVKDAVHQSTRADNSSGTDRGIIQICGNWFRQRGYVRNVKPSKTTVSVDQTSTNSEGREEHNTENSSENSPHVPAVTPGPSTVTTDTSTHGNSDESSGNDEDE